MCEEEGECHELDWQRKYLPNIDKKTAEANMDRRRKEIIDKDPSMVDDIGDRGKYEVEYSIFMESEKRPGFYDQMYQRKMLEKKLTARLEDSNYASRFDSNKYNDLMEGISHTNLFAGKK